MPTKTQATPIPTLIVLWGLPGSGKTTYAEEKYPNDRYFGGVLPVHVLDCDNWGRGTKFDNIVENAVYNLRTRSVLLDGLFTTNEVVERLLTAIMKEIKAFNIEIIFWEENREACLWNDRGRRKKNSKITIENLPFEVPSNQLLKSFNIKMTRMYVERKPYFKVWAAEKGLYSEKDKLCSSSWCLGGTSRNCYGEEHEVSGSAQDISFTELDTFLEEHYPNVTFMQYKKILRDCVESKETGNSDYYGGYVKYAHYECDLESLYKLLSEMGLERDE